MSYFDIALTAEGLYIKGADPTPLVLSFPEANALQAELRKVLTDQQVTLRDA